MAQFDLIVQRVIKLIRQVAGTSVQVYSQPVVEDFVNQAFQFVLSKDWWPQYMRWAQFTLNGTTGVSTTSLKAAAAEIITFEDIRIVHSDTMQWKPIPRLRSDINPFKLTGTAALYVEALPASHADVATKIAQFWPKTATDALVMHHRFRPKETFIDTDKIYLDELMLTYAAVYMYLKDDGSVPDMVDEYKNLFDIRYRDIVKASGNMGVEMRNIDSYPGTAGIPLEWH